MWNQVDLAQKRNSLASVRGVNSSIEFKKLQILENWVEMKTPIPIFSYKRATPGSSTSQSHVRSLIDYYYCRTSITHTSPTVTDSTLLVLNQLAVRILFPIFHTIKPIKPPPHPPHHPPPPPHPPLQSPPAALCCRDGKAFNLDGETTSEAGLAAGHNGPMLHDSMIKKECSDPPNEALLK